MHKLTVHITGFMLILLSALPTQSASSGTSSFPEIQSAPPDTAPAGSLHTDVYRLKILIRQDPDSAQALAMSQFRQRPSNETAARFASLFFVNDLYTHAAWWAEKLAGPLPDTTLQKAIVIILHRAGLQCAGQNRWEEAAGYYERAAVHQPRVPDHYAAAAMAWLKAGNQEKALSVLREGFQTIPGDSAIRSLTKSIHFSFKAFPEYARLLENHLSIHPEDIASRIDLCHAWIAMGRRQEAFSSLENLGKTHPKNPLVFGALADLYRKSLNTEAERRLYHEWLNSHPEQDTLFLNLAGTYRSEANWPMMRHYYRLYLKNHPGNIPVLFETARTYENESSPDSSLQIYRRILNLDGSNIMALQYAGKNAEAAGMPDTAILYYSRWEAASPGSAAPLVAQARVLEHQDQPEAALEKYRQAEQQDGNAQSAFGLFRLYAAKQMPDETEAYLIKSLRRAIPELASAEQTVQARFVRAAGSGEDTGAAITPDMAEDPAAIKKMIRDLAGYGITNYPATVEKALNDLLAEYEDSPLLLELAGDLYTSQKSYVQAAAYYEKYLSLRPRETQNQIKLVTALEKSGNNDKALRLCRAAVEQEPENPAFIRLCIGIADKTGDLPVLARRWEQLCGAHPEYDILRRHLISVWNRLGRNDKVTALLHEGE